MFTVPEVDDDIEVSSSSDVTAKPLTPTEPPTEPPIESPSTPSELVSSTEKEEEHVSIEIQVLPATTEKDSTATTSQAPKQHVSRLTHFHRSTTNGNDQNNDRV
ncbi:unnamed protein product [Adineta steineri]|uniref:Uncharacterized protein n=1 Tax=Adineta steineri TaxID=433720 RepID=A0A815XQL7_9BILA|nr:unnamed protein product [Adineta steineri]CAF1353944.1 unnamed protein product [Adineta steineri]CAF1560528.1 unnamed protein product [Adineta steineri]CAF1560723.1 unnamed protein product [Adineta steineri]CAF1572691.1 unnamed protein product [Adineta steineri]